MNMSILNGCQEGKATPRAEEIKCPHCNEVIEVFVCMSGAAGEAGTILSDETCESCGYEIKAGTPVSKFTIV